MADAQPKDAESRERGVSTASSLSATAKLEKEALALSLAKNAEQHRAARRKARKLREEKRKEKLKRVYTNRWERRVMRYLGRATDKIKHRKRPLVHYDPPSGTLYVGDNKFYGKSFMYFTVTHYLRRGAILVICDPWFSRLVVILLMIHSVSVLYQEPQSTKTSIDESTPFIVNTMEVIDRLLLVFFALELCLAALAMGSRRMLRSPFKLLDILVVAIGITIDLLPKDSEVLVYLLIFNALRPLRVVQRVTGMRKLMLVVVSCLPTMGSVVILVLVLIFLFSMSGVILFSNSLHTRCVDASGEFANVCTGTDTGLEWLAVSCAAGFNCTGGSETPSKWASFDNVGAAILSVLQVMTLDDWMVVGADVMNGFTPFAWFFFFVLTIVGSFWAVNLMLAVITDAFSRFFAEEQEARDAIEMSSREGTTVTTSRAHISKALQGNSNVPAAGAGAAGGANALKVRFQAGEGDDESLSSYASSREEQTLIRERVRASDPHVQAEFRNWVRSLAHMSQASIFHGLRGDTLEAMHSQEVAADKRALMDVSGSDSSSRTTHSGVSVAGASTSFGASCGPESTALDSTLGSTFDASVATSLFDDRDIVAMAQVYNAHGQVNVPETPGLRKLRATREIEGRVRSINAWMSDVDAAKLEPTTAEEDEDNAYTDNNRNMDAMYEPMLVVPEASYAVGTPGKIFDSQEASKPGLTLFDRYMAAARDFDVESSSSSSDSEQTKIERAALGRKRYVGHRERLRRNLQRIAHSVFQVGHLVSDELREQATDIKHLPLRVIVESIHRSPRFTKFMTLIVLVNCAVLMSVHYGMPEGQGVFVDVVCGFVDFVVVADFAAMYYFDGSKAFFKRLQRSFFDVVDGFVAVHCFVDLILAESHLVPELRVVRILRFMKVFRQFELLHWILALVQSSIHYLINLLLLLIMFAIAFAVMGRHAFDGWVPTPAACTDFRLPPECNQRDNCVWVNQTEWMTVADFAPLQRRSVMPAAFENMTYMELLPIIANASLHNVTTAEEQFLDTLVDYRCRQYKEWEGSLPATSRLTFNSFSTSFLTIFNYLTRDNWSAIMYNFMDKSPYSAIYFLAVLLLGGYVLTSLLVAILLVNFGKVDEMQTETAAVAEQKIDEEQARRDAGPAAAVIGGPAAAVAAAGGGPAAAKDPLLAGRLPVTQTPQTVEDALAAELKAHGGVAIVDRQVAEDSESDEDDGEYPDDQIELSAAAATRAAKKAKKLSRRALGWLCDENDPVVDPHFFTGRSFFFFASTNKIRLLCGRVVSGEFFPFQRTLFLMALVHGIVGTLDPTIVSVEVYTVAYALDWCFTIASVIDLAMRCIAQGAAMSQQSFIAHNVSNKADAVAVACSLLAMLLGVLFPTLASSNYVNPALAFKALRPVRLMVRSKATKSVFHAVWKTVPAMLNILGLSAIMFVATAIMCVEAFGGQLMTCSDGSDRSQAECVAQWYAASSNNVILYGNETARLIDRQWENPTMYHFDNVFVSFNSLVMVSVVSQWTNVLYQVVDAPQVPGGSPRRNNRPGVVVFFILWVFFSNFCLLNIFVGTVVDKFTKLKLKMAGSLFLTEEQSEIAHIKKLLHQTGVKKALSLSDKAYINRQLNIWCHKIANNYVFQQLVKLVVLYNIIIIATVHYDQKGVWTDVQLYSTVAVSAVFALEMLIKVCIAGPRAYLAIGFNRIDFFIVVQSMVEVVLYGAVDGYAENPQLQIFRLIRVLRIVREQKGFRRLVHTGFRSLPAMWNIGSLLILVFYMFAFIAMALFKNIRVVLWDDTGKILDSDLNFVNFPRSMITLYLVATLDNWGDIMQGSAVRDPYCVPGEDCGHRVVAYFFFSFFIVAVAFVMINLFIAVVLENFSESVLLPTYMKERMQDVNLFRSAWVTFDPAGRQIVSAANFVPLLRQLPGPRRRLEQLQGKDGGGDTASQCSWTQEEMEYYAAHCAIGLQGEATASTIPTLKQLRVPITWPRQEVLFADAIDAIGEKIFHVQLVTESHAHTKAKRSAAEYGMQFAVVDYYCAVVIQTAWRDYTKAKASPFGSDRARFRKWDAVLAPVLRHIWSHHAVGVFGEESAEDAAKIRKLTRGRRRDRLGAAEEDDAAAGDPSSPGGQKSHIKEKLSLKAALEERMIDVDDEAPEDDSWKTAIGDVSSEGSSDPDVMTEEFWLTDEARRHKRAVEASGRKFDFATDLPLRADGPFQLISLNDLIQRRRRQQAREARLTNDARKKAARLPPRGRPKWEALPQPAEEEMTERVIQPKPMTRNQLMLWQQQVAANPSLRNECPVTFQAIRGRTSSGQPVQDGGNPNGSGASPVGAGKNGSGGSVDASPRSLGVLDTNDGDVPRLDDVIEEMRRRRAEAAAERVRLGDEPSYTETRKRANYVVFDGERSFRKEPKRGVTQEMDDSAAVTRAAMATARSSVHSAEEESGGADATTSSGRNVSGEEYKEL